jgi:hypothetical protein
MNSDQNAVGLKQAMSDLAMSSGSAVAPPVFQPMKTKMAPAPVTVTEAIEEIQSKEAALKAALDVLITDLTTLRAQL